MNTIIVKKKIEDKINIIFMISIIIMFIILLSRIRYGMAEVDENLYLNIPFRIVNGDMFFVDEWNLAQLYSFIMIPICKIYLLLFNSTEGIILFFRFIYIMIQIIVTIIGFVLLKKEDKVLALIVSWIFCLFAPYNIIALSYKTISLMVIYLFFLASQYEAKHNNLRCVFLGTLLAIAVLGNPYLITFWFIYLFISAFMHIQKKKHKVFNMKSWLLLTLGAAIVLCAFILYVLLHISINEFFYKLSLNISWLLDDPTHTNLGIVALILRPFRAVVSFLKTFWMYILSCVAVVILFMCGFKWKIYRKHIFFLITLISCISTVWAAYDGIYNIIVVPLGLTGIIAYVYSQKKKRKMFIFLFIMPIIYSYLLGFSSDIGFLEMAIAFVIPAGVAIYFIKDYVDEIGRDKIGQIALILLIIIQIMSQIFYSTQRFYWEDRHEKLDSIICEGPLAGLITTKEKAKEYKADYYNVSHIKDLTGKYVLFYKSFMCGYFMSRDTKVATYSTFIYNIDGLEDKKLQGYYEIYPEKQPQIIYIDVKTAKKFIKKSEIIAYCNSHNYSYEYCENGAYILRLMQ